MASAKDRKLRLIADGKEAFNFKIVDAETGDILSPSDVEKLRPTAQPENLTFARSRRASTTLPRLLGEGDSWINLLSDLSGYPKTFFDILGASFPNANIGFPGDTFDEILAAKQYKQKLNSGIFRVFVFSGGGNDVLGGGGLVSLLKQKSQGNGSTNPADYIDANALTLVLKKLESGYRMVAKEVKIFEPNILMLIHGYDYAQPRKNGKWLGTPLKNCGFAHDEPLAKKIIAFLVDQFNVTLKSVANDFSHVRHVDVRGTIKTLWHDELHPKTSGAKLVAKLFEKEIGKLLIS